MTIPAPISLLTITGDDATTFLQGQLTQDLAVWPDANQVRRAAWCTVKGRIWATFYIWKIEGGFQLLIANDLAEKTIKRLRMYVLRAKVTIAVSDQPLFLGEVSQTPLNVNEQRDSVGLLANEGKTYGVSFATALPTALDWDTAHIQAGAAWISQGTSEQFVPQAANFELVDGVNFRKGCYPGQEIVARSQYLGKLRRRAVIATMAGDAAPLMADVFIQNEPAPVGSVILAAPGWVLFECPQELIAEKKPLAIAGKPLSVQDLPYKIIDITQ